MQTVPQDTPYFGDVTPETSLRLVDKALTDWLSGMEFRKQHPKVTNVWQSRQFAQNHEMQDGQPTKQAKVWPVLSLSMTGITPALDRRVVANISSLGPTGSLETSYQEVLGTANGTDTEFSGKLSRIGLVPRSLTITARRQIAPGPPPVFTIFTGTDDGEGTLTGSLGTGLNTINYGTSKYYVSFPAAPTAGTEIIATYRSTGTRMFANQEGSELYILPFPLPFDLTYQVDIWTKTQQDMQLLRTALLCRFPFTDETFLDLEVPGYGTQLLRLNLTRIDDTTDLEPGEADRELRNTVSITAHAWIYRIALKKKTIQSMNVVFIDAGSDAENLYDESPFLDWYCDISHYTFSGNPPVLASVLESPTLAPPDRVLAWMSWVDGTLAGIGP
jgi:hypothetical protein